MDCFAVADGTDRHECMRDAVYRILAEVGVRIEHDAALKTLARQGLDVDQARQVVRFSSDVLDETLAHQRTLHAEVLDQAGKPCAPPRKSTAAPRAGARFGLDGNCALYLDYESGRRLNGTRDVQLNSGWSMLSIRSRCCGSVVVWR